MYTDVHQAGLAQFPQGLPLPSASASEPQGTRCFGGGFVGAAGSNNSQAEAAHGWGTDEPEPPSPRNPDLAVNLCEDPC